MKHRSRKFWCKGAMLLLSMPIGCQKPAQKTYDDGDSNKSTGMISGAGGNQASQLVTIPVDFRLNGASLLANEGFDLADATTFNISLEGCASGYTSTADEASTALQVYKFDRNCKAKLTDFVYGGHSFIPTVGDPFATFSAGDIALFDEAGEPGTNAVKVTVLSQLANPVSGTETVVYQFSELIKGADESINEATVSDAHSMTVASQDPPSFTVHSVAFNAITAGGAGQFVITLDCTAGMGVTDVCANVNLSDITYKLIEDTYGSTLTIGQANTIFSTAGTSITLPGDREAPGVVTVNGGFHTVTLDGPNAMATHPHMIFIMQSAGVSYQYFNIDVATLTQD